MTQERSPRERGATTQVREWIRDRVDPRERATTQALTDEVVAWLKQQPDLLDRFLYERLFDLVAEMFRAVMTDTRRARRWLERAAETPEQERARLQQWFDRMEHVSPEKGYVRLGSLKRPELRAARQERATRVRRDQTHLRWYALLEEGLEDDETTVQDRYTAAQVEALYESASDTVTGRMDTILDGVNDAYRRIMFPDEGTETPTPSK